MPLLFRALVLAILTLIAPASASAGTRGADAAPWTAWQSPLQRDHPLAGKIWSRRTGGLVTPAALAEAVGSARLVLLGEVHDNADAHRLQAWLIRQAARGRKPSVVFEMIPPDYADALRRYAASPDRTAAGLGAVLDWERRGWPDWTIYEPVAAAAFALSLELRPGDIDRATLSKVRQGGLEALEAKALKRLRLTAPLGDALAGALRKELYESHCELLPQASLGPMAEVQRLRDAVLAESLRAGAAQDGAILIAGNGHVRTDRAVPWYLARAEARAEAVSVMLLEVEAEADAPEALVPSAPDGSPAADYAWFMPRAEREDPCEALKKRFARP